MIATVKARPSEVASLAKDADLDLFNLTDANTRPLAIRLASRIEDVIRGKHVLSLKDTTNFIASATPPIESTPVIGGNQDDYGERSTPSSKKDGNLVAINFSCSEHIRGYNRER